MPNSTSKAPYLVKLESVTTDTSMQVASDSTDLIRKLQTNALDNVLFAIKCGDDASEVERMATQYELEFNLVSKRMLLETAIVGNISVAEWLMMTFYNDRDSFVVDDKGRNLVHLSIHHKQYDYFYDLIVNPWKKDYDNFGKIDYWCGDHSLPFAVDNSGNILHYAVLTGDAEFLAQILNLRILGKEFPGIKELCEYDAAALSDGGDVIGLDRQANSSDKTPRDLASLRGRKDMIELFDQFHKRVVLTYIGGMKLRGFASGGDIEESREFLKKCKTLLKDCNINNPSQYLQEDPRLNRLFYCGLVTTALNCSDLFVWVMKEFKVSIDAKDRSQIYAEIINGCYRKRPFSNKIDEITNEEEKIATRHRANVTFTMLFVDWSREPVFTEDQLLDDERVKRVQDKWKTKKTFPTYDAVEFVKSMMVEKWKGENPYALSDDDHQMAHEMLSKMDGDSERLAIFRYAISKGIFARPPLHEYVMKGELDMLQWFCDTNKCDLRLPLSSSEATASFLLTYEPIKSLTGSYIDADVVTVAEALCAVAVCQGEFPVFQFLLREKVDNKGFFVNCTNMLHLAAVNNSLLIVKWLVFHEYIPIDTRTKYKSSPNALHLTYLYHSHWAMTNFLEEEIPGAVDDEGHDYDWYRRAKFKREQPDVDWDRLDLIVSQLRETTRMVENEVDFREARNLLESGALGDYLQDPQCWGSYDWLRGNKHRFDKHDVLCGLDEVDCDDYSFVDWFFKFVKRSIKLNREECLQWLVSFYRRIYRVNNVETEEHVHIYFDVTGRLTTLMTYATCVDQPAVAALLQAEILAMEEEDKRRSQITYVYRRYLQGAFVCGATVEEILDRFAENTRSFETLTLTAGDTPGITIEKLASCDETYDCYFLYPKWGPGDRFSTPSPLEVMVWEGHLHLVKWLLELQQLHKNIKILLKAIELAACRPDASTEILPLLLNKLKAIEEQRVTPDSPPHRNVIVRQLMKAMLVSCGSRRLHGSFVQGNVNLSAAKLLLPVLQSYGVNVNAYLDNQDNDNGENDYGDEKRSIFMMTVMNLIHNDTVEGWELLRWVVQLPGLRHDSEVALDTSERLPLHKEWQENDLFHLLGIYSYSPDPHGWAIAKGDVMRDMEVDEIKDKVAHLTRTIEFLLKFSRRDVGQAVGELESAI